MAIYSLTSGTTTDYSKNLDAEDIINVPYSGKYAGITLPAGQYKLECWGSASLNPSSATGKGGYSAGTVTLSKSTTLYVYVGGQPSSSSTNSYRYGGWNGGGASYYGSRTDSGGGGGATDICLVYSDVGLDAYYRYVRSSDSYLSRIIVAGGAGGGYSTSNQTQRAGGYCPYTTTGTAAYIGGMTSAGTVTSSITIGGFGYGATSNYTGDDYSGGGGGWYGGGSAGDTYGGGGSSFVWCDTYASYAPSGYTPTADLKMTDVSVLSGAASMTSPTTGSTETGHSGTGYARITVISVKTAFDVYVKVEGDWKQASKIKTKVNGSWLEVSAIKSKVNNTWV